MASLQPVTFPGPQGYILMPFTPTLIFEYQGSVYYGIPDAQAAADAEAAGYSVGHNPLYPDGAGLFVIVGDPSLEGGPPTETTIGGPPPTAPAPVPTPTPPTAPPSGPTTPTQPVTTPPTTTSSGGSGQSGPLGPVGPVSEPTGGTWDVTSEGSDLLAAWGEYTTLMETTLPGINQSLSNLADRPISG